MTSRNSQEMVQRCRLLLYIIMVIHSTDFLLTITQKILNNSLDISIKTELIHIYTWRIIATPLSGQIEPLYLWSIFNKRCNTYNYMICHTVIHVQEICCRGFTPNLHTSVDRCFSCRHRHVRGVCN